jgi:hypothetical protein
MAQEENSSRMGFSKKLKNGMINQDIVMCLGQVLITFPTPQVGVPLVVVRPIVKTPQQFPTW